MCSLLSWWIITLWVKSRGHWEGKFVRNHSFHFALFTEFLFCTGQCAESCQPTDAMTHKASSRTVYDGSRSRLVVAQEQGKLKSRRQFLSWAFKGEKQWPRWGQSRTFRREQRPSAGLRRQHLENCQDWISLRCPGYSFSFVKLPLKRKACSISHNSHNICPPAFFPLRSECPSSIIPQTPMWSRLWRHPGDHTFKLLRASLVNTFACV